MIDKTVSLSILRNRFLAIFSALTVLIIFRAYLVPNTVPVWFDAWRDAQASYIGVHSLFSAAIGVCVLAMTIWGLYYPLASKDANVVGVWLATGAWLGVTAATIIVSSHDLPLVVREVDLLLGYVGGLTAARLFRRLDGYISALVTCGAVQSVFAIVYQSKGIHTLLSGNVMRAGGTFDTPSDLYLIPLFILPLAVQKILSSNNTISSAYYMLCSSSLLAALVLTWERSGFVAVCIGLFWLARNRIANRGQVVAFAVILVLTCGVFFERSNGPVNYASSMRSVHSRTFLFNAGVLIFSHHLLNGVGVGSLTLPVAVTINHKTQSVQMLQPFNQFLYWLDEMGIFGGVLAAVFAAFIYKTVSSSTSSIARGLAAVWISVLVAGMFNTLFGCWDFSCGNMLIGSLLGMTMRLKNVDETNQTSAVAENVRSVD